MWAIKGEPKKYVSYTKEEDGQWKYCEGEYISNIILFLIIMQLYYLLKIIEFKFNFINQKHSYYPVKHIF